MLNILAVGVTTGLSLENPPPGEPGSDEAVTLVVDLITELTTGVFILEAVLKLVARGPHPEHYFTAPRGEGSFNCFDFLLVVLSVALAGENSAGALKTLRLARLVRLLTIIKNVPELKVIVEGLVAGLKSVGYIVLLLLLVIYLFAVLGVMQFGANDPANFGTVPTAMITLFQGATLTNWSMSAYANWYGCDTFEEAFYKRIPNDEAVGTVMTRTGPMMIWECNAPSQQPGFTFIYFTAFTILTAMVIMSLFIGVITMGMFDAYQGMKTTKAMEEYNASLLVAENDMFGEGSYMARCVDAAMSPYPRRSVRKPHGDFFLDNFQNVRAHACARRHSRSTRLHGFERGKQQFHAPLSPTLPSMQYTHNRFRGCAA